MADFQIADAISRLGSSVASAGSSVSSSLDAVAVAIELHAVAVLASNRGPMDSAVENAKNALRRGYKR